MPNWTPGPWVARGIEVRDLIFSGHNKSTLIASIIDRRASWDYEKQCIKRSPEAVSEINANSDLIAAAPELLEALKMCLEQLDAMRGYFEGEWRCPGDPPDVEYEREIAIIKAAIEKAEGR